MSLPNLQSSSGPSAAGNRPQPTGRARSGLAALAPQLGRLWALKAVGLTGGMTLFFVGYFSVLHHPQFPVTVVPPLFLDRWIPFQPGWLGAYASLWIYISLLPGLLGQKRELLRYAVAAAALAAVGLTIFFFWPTTIAPPDIDWGRHPSVAFLKTVDATGNAFPSLHVAFAVFTAYGLDRLLRASHASRLARAANAGWCAAILFSTLAVKQHVTLDVLAGAVLGAAVAWAWRSPDGRAR